MTQMKISRQKVSDLEILEQYYLENKDKLATLFDRSIIDETSCLINKKCDEGIWI